MDRPALHGEALLKALAEISVKVGGGHSVDTVLHSAGEGVLGLGLQLVGVQFQAGQAFLRYLNRAPTTEIGRRMLKPAPIALAPIFRAIFELAAPVYVADLGDWLAAAGTEKSTIEIGVQAGFGKLVITPLMVGQVKWGALILGSNQLAEADVPALTLFSAQLYSSLEVAETIERLETRNRELEAVHAIAATRSPELNSARLLETVARATRSDAVALHRFEPESAEYVLVGESWGYAGKLIERWRRFKAGTQEQTTNQTVRVAQVAVDPALQQEGFLQLARVALSFEGQPVGMLTLGRRTDLPFSADEVRNAELLGVQVSSLMERARLIAEASKRVRQLELLYEMTSASAVVGHVGSVIQRLLAQMLDALPVDVSAIHFLEGTQLRLAGWKVREGGPPGSPTPEFMPIDDTSVVGRTVLSRKSNRYIRADFPSFTVIAGGRLGLEHMMSAPLLVGDRLVGTLTVGRCADAAFTLEEVQLVESCAVHVAVILEHVRLYDDLKLSYDELAHAQAELVKHERLAALGELSAVMAHEVRNPLGVIFNSLASLKRLIKPMGDSELLLNIIGEEADRLNRIVGDLLDFARPFEAQKKPISLEAILGSAVDAAISSVPNALGKVMVEFPSELPRFQIDGQLVRQAFVNLVVNALQAMPSGGKVTVLAVPEERAGELWVRIEVCDEGSGIPAASAERIFQPFFTTKATGTGLGLAVVKRIIDAHHGEVTVKPRPEGGTIFTIRLPGGVAPGGPPGREEDEVEDTMPGIRTG